VSLQIGRIGLATANGGDGYTLDDASTITQSGRSFHLDGIQSGTTAGLLWLRDQFMGLLDPGSDPVIPVRFSTISQLDGYYRVDGAQVDHPRGGLGASGSGNWTTWSVDLTRITDWAKPRVDVYLASALLPNTLSVTSGDYLVGAPGTFDVHSLISIDHTRPNSDGMNQAVAYLAGATAAQTLTGRASIRPQYWYQGGCRVEYDVNNDGNYYAVVGRQPIPTPNTGRLRISNGLVRLNWNDSSGPLNIYWYDGSTWDGPTGFTLQYSAVDLAAYSATVTRNTPQECSVRFETGGAGGSLAGGTWADVSVRRGSRNVYIYLSSSDSLVSLTAAWNGKFTTSTACTTLTSGLRRTSNNAGGNREIIGADKGSTITTGSGQVGVPALAGWAMYAIGCEVDGSSATGNKTAAHQLAELFYPVSVSQVIVLL
jgi:hypothetical protein